MINKVTNLAERLATNVGLSRRGFLGRMGQGALAVAGALGGLLVFPKDGLGGPGSYVCCTWHCGSLGGFVCDFLRIFEGQQDSPADFHRILEAL